jgi:anti-anti-sigma factor
MTATTIETVREMDFTAEAAVKDGALVLSLTGNADLNVKFQLDRFLAAVHAEAQRLNIEEVTVDVRSLEFMNSSCLKCLVGWISQIQDQPPARQYRVSFLSSPSLYWQRRSLHALSCLASDLVTVQN